MFQIKLGNLSNIEKKTTKFTKLGKIQLLGRNARLVPSRSEPMHNLFPSQAISVIRRAAGSSGSQISNLKQFPNSYNFLCYASEVTDFRGVRT